MFIFNTLFAVNYYNGSIVRVQSQCWHRDPGARRNIKFFIMFNDAGELEGSFEYIPNTQYTSTHRLTNIFDFNDQSSIYPGNYINTTEYNNFIDISNKYSISTKSKQGDCIAADTSGFHRAGMVHPNKYRKYIHMLFLTKNDIIQNQDPVDKYQNGFNFNRMNDINYTD